MLQELTIARDCSTGRTSSRLGTTCKVGVDEDVQGVAIGIGEWETVNHPGVVMEVTHQMFKFPHARGCRSGELSAQFFGSKRDARAIKWHIVAPRRERPEHRRLLLCEFIAKVFELLCLFHSLVAHSFLFNFPLQPP